MHRVVAFLFGAALVLSPLAAAQMAGPGASPSGLSRDSASGGGAPLVRPDVPSAGPGILEPAATPSAPNDAAGPVHDRGKPPIGSHAADPASGGPGAGPITGGRSASDASRGAPSPR